MKQENIFENMKLNKSEIVKQRVGERRGSVRKHLCERIGVV